MNPFLPQTPDFITVQTPAGVHRLQSAQPGRWNGAGIELTLTAAGDATEIWLHAPHASLSHLRLHWKLPLPSGARILGDAWERGYGDLEWRGVVPDRPLPWYFAAATANETCLAGVDVAPAAFCAWYVDQHSVILHLDVRNGGAPVTPGDRQVLLARARSTRLDAEVSAYQALREFLKKLCPVHRSPQQPVYGANDWYYAYGTNTRAGILRDSQVTSHLAPHPTNRPFSVVDGGWQYAGEANGEPWVGNTRFGDMHTLAEGIRSTGCRPGIWFRPLLSLRDVPASWRLHTTQPGGEPGWVLDPSEPGVLEIVQSHIRQFKEWGYELIKHDFSTYDLFHRWGFEMGGSVTRDGWGFHDRTRTSAEIILRLYEAIRSAADDTILIGCNTVSHLAAGLVELQRTGDDTSGREWNRTRRMGLNTLAFRMPQHNVFYASDADCVGLTELIPWRLNAQWLEVLSRSGTPLFVSADPAALGEEQKAALRAAYARAAEPQPEAEPLDWFDAATPTRWRFGEEQVEYDWSEE